MPGHLDVRSVKLLCEHLGVSPPCHTLPSVPHTITANYLRSGGSVFHRMAAQFPVSDGIPRRRAWAIRTYTRICKF